MVQSQDASKICIRCGQDCSQRPRVKNAQGRYCCRACLDAAPLPAAPGLAPAHATPTAPADEPDLIAVEESESYKKTRAPCYRCGGQLTLGIPACPHCGFDPALLPPEQPVKRRKPRPKAAPKKCKNCDYDLAGIPVSPQGRITCPECGHVNAVSFRRVEDEQYGKERAKWALIKPVIYLGVGTLISMGIFAVQAQWLNMVAYLGVFTLGVGLGFGVLWLCCLWWVGFNDPLPTMVLQVAGVHAAAGATGIFVGLASPPMPQFLVAVTMAVVYSVLLADFTEMDFGDACLVCLLFGVAAVTLGGIVAFL